MNAPFSSLYSHGFVRVAAATMRTHIAEPDRNASEVIEQAKRLDDAGVALVAFPELCLVGYSIDDLLLNDALLESADQALTRVVGASKTMRCVIVVGAPIRYRNRLYNCAIVIARGRVLGVIPKSYIPSYREFYEGRYFEPGDRIMAEVLVAGVEVPMCPHLLFRATDVPDFVFHVEVCEDMWVPVPPSSLAALSGATILVNISSSPITVGRANDRELLCASASMRCLSAYVYASGGVGESTTDLAWDGHAMIHENGRLLASNERFAKEPGAAVADVDLDSLRHARLVQGTFQDNKDLTSIYFTEITFELSPPDTDLGLLRPVDRFPFVPDDEAALDRDCFEAFNIQTAGLETRLRSIGQPKIVIGVSGGLDSTHALLVAATTMDRLGRPRSDILAYTMPGFATSSHTRDNATELARSLGCSFETLDIRPAAEQMLRDLNHPYGEGKDVYDVTFENVQAGLRTDYLFRLANHKGGIVLGTGDLSELALGWCTFGVGDHMAHYGVNAGVPKTLIQHLIRWVIASGVFEATVVDVLESILATEISPELVPARSGEAPQSTQAVIGPYELQDFTLFQVLRHGFKPAKIAFLAHHAWSDAGAGTWPRGIEGDDRHAYDLGEIKKWMRVFFGRFVTQQFKRSTLPNGPKVVRGGSLSPRGDWRMPSDASPAIWLADVESIPDVWS